MRVLSQTTLWLLLCLAPASADAQRDILVPTPTGVFARFAAGGCGHWREPSGALDPNHPLCLEPRLIGAFGTRTGLCGVVAAPGPHTRSVAIRCVHDGVTGRISTRTTIALPRVANPPDPNDYLHVFFNGGARRGGHVALVLDFQSRGRNYAVLAISHDHGHRFRTTPTQAFSRSQVTISRTGVVRTYTLYDDEGIITACWTRTPRGRTTRSGCDTTPDAEPAIALLHRGRLHSRGEGVIWRRREGRVRIPAPVRYEARVVVGTGGTWLLDDDRMLYRLARRATRLGPAPVGEIVAEDGRGRLLGLGAGEVWRRSAGGGWRRLFELRPPRR